MQKKLLQTKRWEPDSQANRKGMAWVNVEN